MLKPPEFVRDAGVMDTPVAHEWEGTVHYNRENPQLGKKLFAMAPANVLALGLATAEWIYWRFSHLTDAREPILLIEAAWAFAIDPAYLRLPEKYVTTKGDPLVAGPLNALTELLSGLVSGELSRRTNPKRAGGVPSWRVGHLSFLARHVLPKPKPYETWLKDAIDRFSKWQPKPADNGYGVPVPRQAMDPKASVKPADAPKLLDEFLRGLDPGTNPFLRPPVELTAAGFEGAPYRQRG